MKAVLLDTHVWFWLLSGARPLPAIVKSGIELAPRSLVSSITLYEIARKTSLGKWPGMDRSELDELIRQSARGGIEIEPLGDAALIGAGFLDWDHRDPWDRLIAATALESGATLISADPAFDAVQGLERLWQ